MTRHRLSWLLFTLASGAVLAVACGGDDDTTGAGGSSGKAGSGGSTATGGTAGTGGTGGSSGTGGTAGTAGKDGGSKDAATTIPCGEQNCNPNGTNRYCDSAAGRCVSCLNDMHCAGNMQNPPRLRCDTAAGACRSCLTNADCTAPQTCVTGMTNNTCQLRCASDADCATAPNNNRACNLTTMMCVQCQNNTHCVGNAGGPICEASSSTCVVCAANTDCAAPTPICITQGTNRCAECNANTDCTAPGLPACVQNVCRQCSGSAPCPAGNVCSMNTCVPAPEPGPPDSGRDGTAEGGSEGGSDTGTDAPAADAPADTSGGG